MVRIAPAKTLPDPEEPPVVMPSPDMPVDGTSSDAGVDAAVFSVGEEEPRRARNADGTYRGDDPSTPDVNEAWEGGEEPPAKGKRGRKKR